MNDAKLRTLGEIFELAIQREQEAADFYFGMARVATPPGMAQVFIDLGHEELGHKARLQKAYERGGHTQGHGTPLDLKIAEYVTPTQPLDTMTYEDAVVLALHREAAAYQLYSDLAELMTDATLAFLFRSLAAEEARHRHRFEVEYDEHVLKQN